ncbi:helix-turn-helix protein [Paenibacillus cellulosilyticus]|uniref:Helix-turn-helix protein n=1 Tax=Paenibacillus cellulosilyticus TaxID=375489 RepID=A0A2V2YTB5_9BACL|nr:helix-turn-helix transcriptional regulator [Paenibacillus cellulosilyticus]PWW02499.1 helix-turn-helix protein [Paenibacillus cellulosilyticus]QKS47201.1 helix-turn-helix transcriptional regulator [Paenibacillus cellulosilyticus]
MNDALTKVGKRIREIRKAKGLSQEKLGEECGFTFSYIGGIERAENNVSIRNLEKIANALNVELYEFFIDLRSERKLAAKAKQVDEIEELLINLDNKQLAKAKTILFEIFKK